MRKRIALSRTTSTGSSVLPSVAILDKEDLEAVDVRGVRDDCDFSISRDGPWYVFEGTVDSQATKTELFALVPEVDGAQWIVDKLRATPLRRRRRSS